MQERSTDEDTDPGAGRALGRRQALLAGAGGAMALALAACGSDGSDGDSSSPATQGQTPEVRGLLAMLGRERRASDTYQSGIPFSDKAQAALLQRLAEQGTEHAQALQELISAAGGPTPPMGATGQPAFIRDAGSARLAALAVSRQLIGGYIEMIPTSESSDRRRELVSILGNDAQHLTLLGGGFVIDSGLLDG